MNMYDPTPAQKKQILEANLKNLGQQIYDHVIAKRVADRVGDEEAGSRQVAALEKLERARDVYLEELASLDQE